jgi:hypothetical protein
MQWMIQQVCLLVTPAAASEASCASFLIFEHVVEEVNICDTRSEAVTRGAGILGLLLEVSM